ncbi:Protein CBG04857 [Caenorhabditis briggsae]|uniref:Protein CBG04857 n=1 Tax=Caenorhabditis briggsae TaxID=6238 RepID=A8WYM9_CAEBR|nr:Protein CBG04857 [Caenorhabditis briggsae]CAP25487.2 Protein CBG04857 [Caenorhabditis briggsae]
MNAPATENNKNMARYFLIGCFIICVAPVVYICAIGFLMSLFEGYLADLTIIHLLTVICLSIYIYIYFKELKEQAKFQKNLNLSNFDEEKYTKAKMILKVVLFFLTLYGFYFCSGQLSYAGVYNPRYDFYFQSLIFCIIFLVLFGLQIASFLCGKLNILQKFINEKIVESFKTLI